MLASFRQANCLHLYTRNWGVDCIIGGGFFFAEDGGGLLLNVVDIGTGLEIGQLGV